VKGERQKETKKNGKQGKEMWWLYSEQVSLSTYETQITVVCVPFHKSAML
jgi:hypothetical protein